MKTTVGKNDKLFGAIEAGGTKWVCAIGSASGELIEELVIPTDHPSRTMPEVLRALDDLQSRHGEMAGLGIATFGPVMLNRRSEDYGMILNTPKEEWRGYRLVEAVTAHLGNSFPVVVETDVNAAALAEYRASKTEGTLIYITVGTGIGGGVISDGEIWHGRAHPEIGHLMVPESKLEPALGFSGCRFHHSCVEGKASGASMFRRWGIDSRDLPENHVGWVLEAEYLASLAVSLTATFSPDQIIFGGGVIQFQPLLSMIHEQFVDKEGGYWDLPNVEQYLVKSSLANRAGTRGALLLASEKL